EVVNVVVHFLEDLPPALPLGERLELLRKGRRLRESLEPQRLEEVARRPAQIDEALPRFQVRIDERRDELQNPLPLEDILDMDRMDLAASRPRRESRRQAPIAVGIRTHEPRKRRVGGKFGQGIAETPETLLERPRLLPTGVVDGQLQLRLVLQRQRPRSTA